MCGFVVLPGKYTVTWAFTNTDVADLRNCFTSVNNSEYYVVIAKIIGHSADSDPNSKHGMRKKYKIHC